MYQIDALDDNRLVSASYDRRPIVWKMDMDSQMIYRERNFSLDCISCLNQHHFITGSEDGELCVWNVSKKNPRLTL